MCHVLLINFLMIMEKAVCTLGSITLQDKKIKIKQLQIFECPTFDKHFGFIFVATSNWIERYSTMKIGRFFFV